eukprot:402587_1
MNDVAVGVIMKVLINNDENDKAFKIYNTFSWLNNNITHMLAIKACKNMNNYDAGNNIYCNIINSIECIQLENTMIDFYVSFGDIIKAQSVFNKISNENKDVVCINSMMTAFINNGYDKQAIVLYETYHWLHDNISHALALKACTNCKENGKGKAIHKFIGKTDDIYINTSLINFYGHCEDIDNALNIFNSMDNNNKNIVCINAMMQAYITNDLPINCIELFQNLSKINKSLIPDKVFYVTALKACTHASILQLGQEIHQQLKLNYMINDPLVQMHLINMYGKCGMIEACKNIFDNIETKELSIYDSMLYAFGRNSDIKSA